MTEQNEHTWDEFEQPIEESKGRLGLFAKIAAVALFGLAIWFFTTRIQTS